MSVVSSDLVIYGAANIAESDSGTMGGAIDTTVRYVFNSATLVNDPTASGGDGELTVVSDNVADTMNITVTGRNASGSIVSQTIALNGTTVVDITTNTFERLLKVELASSAAGTVTLADNANGAGTIGNTIVTIETGVTEIRTPFYNVSADVSGGSARTFYEKVFLKNNNSTNALLSTVIVESADPSSNVTFALEDAVDDTGTSTNRVTAPSASEIGASGFDSADKTMSTETDASTADLAAGSAIGIWLALTLAAGASAAKTTYTLQAQGSTT